MIKFDSNSFYFFLHCRSTVADFHFIAEDAMLAAGLFIKKNDF